MAASTPTIGYITPSGRDLRLDFLRGFFMFVMVVNHISGSSVLHYITFKNAFFTSAAEGFFLVSGIVTGVVHSKIYLREGIGASIKKSMRRLLNIYLLMVSLSLFVIFLGEHFHLFYSQGISLADPIVIIQQILAFQLSYFYVDVLVVFSLLFFFLPYALILLELNKPGWLLLISFGVYIFYLIYPDHPWLPIKTFMEFSGVQLFFFGGLVLGYTKSLNHFQKYLKTRWLVVFGILTMGLIIFWNMIYHQGLFQFAPFSDQTQAWILEFFYKPKVNPGRFLASAIVFTFLYILLSVAWGGINRILGWLFLTLGQHALFAYTAHVVLAVLFYIVTLFIGYDGQDYWLNGVIQIAVILIIWGSIKLKVFTPWGKNRNVYYSLAGIVIVIFIGLELVYRIPFIHTFLSPLLHQFIIK